MDLEGFGYIIGIWTEFQFIITPLLSAVAGFVGGWVVHINKTNKERSYIHLKDLNENIVVPVIHFLKVKPYALPSIDDVSDYSIMSTMPAPDTIYLEPIERLRQNKELDSVLLSDFLDNHYPEVKNFWNSFSRFNSQAQEKDALVYRLIGEKITTLLGRREYKKLSDINNDR